MSFVPSPRVFRLLAVAGGLAAPFAGAITPADLAARLSHNEAILVVDIRPTTAYAAGHVPGAINLPADLLPYKRLPESPLTVVCGDGLGAVDEQPAIDRLRAGSGGAVEALSGGYAAWVSETRLTTAAPGVTRERVPGITYDQFVAARKGDIVLVDVRPVAPVAAKGVHAVKSATTEESDIVAGFARRTGVPLVSAKAAGGGAPARAALAPAGANAAATPAVTGDALDQPGKLLVLVADNEADATAVARELRSRGRYRFTVLIGGTDAIRHEGKVGSGRMTGGTYAGPSE